MIYRPMATSTYSSYITKHFIKYSYFKNNPSKSVIIFSSFSPCPFSLSFSLHPASQTRVCLVHPVHRVQCNISYPWPLDSWYQGPTSRPCPTLPTVTLTLLISFLFPPSFPIFFQTFFHLFSFQAVIKKIMNTERLWWQNIKTIPLNACFFLSFYLQNIY